MTFIWLSLNDMSNVSAIGILCTAEQGWHKAYTLNTQLKHWLLCQLPWSMLSMFLHTSQKYWEWKSDDFNNEQEVWWAMGIKGVYHYKMASIPPLSLLHQYNEAILAQWKMQVTLYCILAYQNLFARYVLYHHKYIDYVFMVLCCFWPFLATDYDYICLIKTKNTVDLIDCSSYNYYWLRRKSCLSWYLICLEFELENNGSWLKEIWVLDQRTKNLRHWVNLIQ